jgi:type II secretory pathway component GspD/PulD (secretin)
MKKIGLMTLFIFLFNIAYAQQVSNNIKSLLSSEGKALYGDEPNSIVVIDYPENLKDVAEYLETADSPPAQVLIEARLVEVKLQKEHSLGINWTLVGSRADPSIDLFGTSYQVAGATSTTAIAQSIAYKSTYYPPLGTTGSEEPFTLTIFNKNIETVLKALATSLNTDVLSAPQVTTVNNHAAEIKVVQQVPWAEPEVQMSDQGIAVTWKINFETIGIILKVTPTINSDDKITMELVPEISEKVSDYPLSVIQGTTEIDYTVPVIDKRSASTKVVIGNGQTLIIGGMIKNKMLGGETKIPLLGDIPWLGHFFKSKKTTQDKTELLIFVSPTIITENQFRRMENEEKYGVAKNLYDDRKRQEKMRKSLEEKAEDTKKDAVNALDALSKKHESLVRQRKALELEVNKQENEFKSIEINKKTVTPNKQRPVK